MRRPSWIRSVWQPKAERPAGAGFLRDRLALLLALVTVVSLGLVFFLAKGRQFLMPGPLTSAHGAIENCSACHTKSGNGKMSWLHGLVAGDPFADSKACLTCHKMPDTAFNAHGASAEVLKQSTERLTKIAVATPAPQSAVAQNVAFPTHDVMSRGLYCATCHQEHKGVNFKLNKISNEQCRSCHVVKFGSFDGDHPKFDNYPFKRRTRIVYDHAGHFGKHFPEVAKKDPTKRIPATCSTCHDTRDDKRIMAVAPFEQTCTSCHLDQIVGKERVSGPKGIAFLTLPGLDLQTLKEKNASIGEWPEESDAALTPFMKVIISREERGRALIKTVDSLNLQDLTKASDDQIKAVMNLVWEIKGLFHKLISGKASDVLADLNIGTGKLSANVIKDLTASIPRDVVISAQQQWLPNLAKEMDRRPATSDQSGWSVSITDTQSNGSASPQDPSGLDARQSAPRASSNATNSEKAGPVAGAREPSASSSATSESSGSESAEDLSDEDARQAAPKTSAQAANSEAASKSKLDPPPCMVRVLGQCLVFKGQQNEAEATDKNAFSASDLPGAMRAGVKDAAPAAEPEGTAGKTDAPNAKADGGKEKVSTDGAPGGKATDQSDDLLFPTEDELREIKARSKGTDKAAQPEEGAARSDSANAGPDGPVSSDSAPSKDPAGTQTAAQPAISIASDVDSESWAEYGGWYRQDYGIFYRPTDHKDKFIYSWLALTGPQAPKGEASPAAAVFDFLTSKDAQGSCTKCHSIDDIQGKGRVVNFSPPSVEKKQGRFTNFIHEPHFGIIEKRGCLTCHSLEKDRPYLKSYEQGNPQNFVSNFGSVKKDLCQSCHTSSMARQDCLLCHKYHVNDVITPITNTKVPTQ